MCRLLLPTGLVAAAIGFVSTAAGAVPDWPQWRGPNRDGVCAETGLLQEWPDGGPPLLWKVTGIGKGFSGVAVVGDRLYTMGDRDDAQFILCLDRNTRKELWAAKVGKTWYDGTRCTPTVDGESGLVFGIGTHGDLVCVQAADGKEVWRKSFAADFGGKMMSAWGFSESPLVDGRKLVCTPGGPKAGIVALVKTTGRDIWRCAVPKVGPNGCDGAGYASIVATEVGGIRQYVQLMGRGVVGVAADDGRFLWGYNRVANGSANITTPVVRGEYVFCSTAYFTGSALLKLTPDGAGGVKADEVYFLGPDTFQNHHGGVVLVGDYLYGGHGFNAGQPVCIEFLTGRIVWRAEKPPARGSSCATYADGRLYVRYDNFIMSLVEATPDGYREKGALKTVKGIGPSWSHPVVHDGKLYLRDHDLLLCYDIRKR